MIRKINPKLKPIKFEDLKKGDIVSFATGNKGRFSDFLIYEKNPKYIKTMPIVYKKSKNDYNTKYNLGFNDELTRKISHNLGIEPNHGPFLGFFYSNIVTPNQLRPALCVKRFNLKDLVPKKDVLNVYADIANNFHKIAINYSKWIKIPKTKRDHILSDPHLKKQANHKFLTDNLLKHYPISKTMPNVNYINKPNETHLNYIPTKAKSLKYNEKQHIYIPKPYKHVTNLKELKPYMLIRLTMHHASGPDKWRPLIVTHVYRNRFTCLPITHTLPKTTKGSVYSKQVKNQKLQKAINKYYNPDLNDEKTSVINYGNSLSFDFNDLAKIQYPQYLGDLRKDIPKTDLLKINQTETAVEQKLIKSVKTYIKEKKHYGTVHNYKKRYDKGELISPKDLAIFYKGLRNNTYTKDIVLPKYAEKNLTPVKNQRYNSTILKSDNESPTDEDEPDL